MSPSHVHEPTYRALKARLRRGAWPMGARLEATRLADELGVSVTPVRDCLNRLAGERLVELWPREGYRVASISERELRDLIMFNRTILGCALPGDAQAPGLAPGDDASRNDLRLDDARPDAAAIAYADLMASSFSVLAARSRNAVLVEVVDALTDRLYPMRCLDAVLFPHASADLAQLTRLLASRAAAGPLTAWLDRYHALCMSAVADYVALRQHAPDPI